MANEPETTVIEHGDGSESVIVDIPADDEASGEAVEIAKIEADASVQIAETQAAVEITRIENDAEHANEIAQLRERNSWLEQQMTNMATQHQAEIASLSTPQPSQEAVEELVEEAEALAETVEELAETETIDTPETKTATSSSTPMEAPEKSDGDGPVAEAVELAAAVKRKIRLL